MKKAPRPIRDFLAYGLFASVLKLLPILPTCWALSLGRFVGNLLYFIDLRHRDVACRNIARVFALDRDEPDTRKLARSAFRHLGQVAVEFALLPDDLGEKTYGRPLLAMDGVENARKAYELGRGLVLVTGHTGNWELLGAYISRHVAPFAPVTRTFRNPYLDAYIRRRRARFYPEIISKKGAVKKAARMLKRGGVVAFLMDQHAGSSEPKLDFLGIPAHTFLTPGALAVRFRTPVVAGFCYRVGSGFDYKGYIEAPLFPDVNGDPMEEALRITRYANEAIGRFVRAHPEQWHWMHRRWR